MSRPEHWRRPVIEVEYATLEAMSKDGAGSMRRQCPECPGGVLLMRRDVWTWDLLNTDRCVVCGQAFKYTDVVDGKRPGVMG